MMSRSTPLQLEVGGLLRCFSWPRLGKTILTRLPQLRPNYAEGSLRKMAQGLDRCFQPERATRHKTPCLPSLAASHNM